MIEIKFYARGGQGAVTAAKVLVQAAIYDCKFAQAIPSYGQERQGAPVFSFARIDKDYIATKSYVEEPDCVIVFDEGLKESGIDVLENIKDNSIVIVNAAKNPKEYLENESIGKLVVVDADKITNELIGRVPPNMAILGAVVKAIEVVKIESICEAIKFKIKGKAGELNAESARKAYQAATVYHR